MANILVVEDDAVERSILERSLAGAGHQVNAVAGGQAALARLREKRFDLLFTDLMMEEGTGFEVLEWVRENAPGLPVVIYSSYAKVDNLRPFLSTQLYRVVRKPCAPEDLATLVVNLLGGVPGVG